MRAFLGYAADVVVRPRATFRALLADPRRVSFGFGGILALSVAYFASISLGIKHNGGMKPDAKRLVLRIPASRYYAYERFFILPVGLGETILTAGVIRLLAQRWGGQGRFEDLFALFGFSHVTIIPSMTIPDTAAIFLPMRRGNLSYVVPGTLWMLVLLILAIQEAEHLPWAKSVAVALPAALANAAVEYIFIR